MKQHTLIAALALSANAANAQAPHTPRETAGRGSGSEARPTILLVPTVGQARSGPSGYIHRARKGSAERPASYVRSGPSRR